VDAVMSVIDLLRGHMIRALYPDPFALDPVVPGLGWFETPDTPRIGSLPVRAG
jgi:hypothetical protein